MGADLFGRGRAVSKQRPTHIIFAKRFTHHFLSSGMTAGCGHAGKDLETEGQILPEGKAVVIATSASALIPSVYTDE
ncbi:hypothetical protein U8291_13715 [Pseudomonas sp. A2]|uniref:hypothetical protein n=1 Tax=Pseudomonas sp. A2 TaxID=107445 RepID=UPI002BFB2F7E|nr:hypothetical protein [Pseudomonas sp. A2]MEB3438072.1 hypothetical protein [Pseudomonas sp. A2]